MDNESIKCFRAAHPDGDIMSEALQGYSFPSLHASMSSSTYATIAVDTKKKVTTALAFFMPFMIGLSRLFLGVHYPTDVLAGWGLGLICLAVFGPIERKFGYKAAYIVLLIIGATGFFFCKDTEYFTCYGLILGLLGGFAFEERFVKFEYSRKWWSYILRPLLGMAIFAALNVLLKIPAKTIPAESIVAMFYRMFRYAISIAAVIGVYPMMFKRCKF